MSTQSARLPVRRMKPSERRAQILGEAFALISERGYNAVSLADIARASGIQKSSVLHHFPSMTELLLAVLQMREVEDFEFYRDDPLPADATDPASTRQRVTRIFLHNQQRQELVRLYTILAVEALAPEHPAHAYFRQRALSARAELAQLLPWKTDPDLAAAELLAFWDGLELAHRHDPELDVIAVWEAFCDRFFA